MMNWWFAWYATRKTSSNTKSVLFTPTWPADSQPLLAPLTSTSSNYVEKGRTSSVHTLETRWSPSLTSHLSGVQKSVSSQNVSDFTPIGDYGPNQRVAQGEIVSAKQE